jgi:hypothetical protein
MRSVRWQNRSFDLAPPSAGARFEVWLLHPSKSSKPRKQAVGFGDDVGARLSGQIPIRHLAHTQVQVI